MHLRVASSLTSKNFKNINSYKQGKPRPMIPHKDYINYDKLEKLNKKLTVALEICVPDKSVHAMENKECKLVWEEIIEIIDKDE